MPQEFHFRFSASFWEGLLAAEQLVSSRRIYTRKASGVMTGGSQGRNAMASKTLVNTQEKAKCPICLKHLTELLTLGCGHSYCQTCISRNKKSVTSPGGENRCFICSIRNLFGNTKANQPPADVAEGLREVKLSPSTVQNADLCARHGENLLLFCVEDRKVICWLCELSQEHRGHRTLFMDEVTKECQDKLQAVLKRLRKEQEEAEKLEADIQEEITSWKFQVETERKRIQMEFNHLRRILDSEEERELQRLDREEKTTLDSLAEAEDELVYQKQLVKELLSDLERRSQWSTMELLQDTSGIMKWSEIWTLKKPKTVSKKLKTVFRAPDLRGMLQSFRELTDAQCYWVDLTLNPGNLNLNLALSEDERQVTSVCIWPLKRYDCGILSSQHFSSGKHYWEVDVSKKTSWILGVHCRKRSAKYAERKDANHTNVSSTYRPKYGYWVIGLQNNFEYIVFEDSSSSDPKVLALFMAIPPRRVGVFLDYEAGIVSFLNVTNHGSLIYKFSKCYFSQPAYAYFNLYKCPAPMTLCLPNC
ncbi:tripartite motif-containing protein 34 isoform X3 [Marmota marmota marmota]|nr:tripartite motif-containing protein 34 isoform X3 [Marmota marmota marmota]